MIKAEHWQEIKWSGVATLIVENWNETGGASFKWNIMGPTTALAEH